MATEIKDTHSAYAEPVVEPRRRFSLVWLVPIAAAAIAIWLVIVGFHEKGPRITVSFETADGLEAGKTKVKYRDVQVGLLDSLEISPDRRSVIASIDIAKFASDYLTETANFWVVRPRLDAEGISGLGTLISGAYIELDPGAPGKRLDHYVALETPPVVRTDAPGKKFILRAENANSLEARTPIFYRGIRVGQVLGYDVNSVGAHVDSSIFIKKPFDRIVTQDSRFWRRGGVELEAGPDGFKVRIGSLTELLAGGIEFETPGGQNPTGSSVAEGHAFTLYDNKEAIGDAAIVEKIPYVLYFDGSVRGLTVGAPVELQGIRVGTVASIRPQVNLETNTFRIAVRIDLEPQRFGDIADITEVGERKKFSFVAALVQKGLRAQIETASLLTGQKMVNLEFFSDEPPETLDTNQSIPEIPTRPESFEQIATTLERIVRRIDTLPLDTIVARAEDAIVSLDEMLRDTRLLMQSGNRNLDPLVTDLRAAAVAARSTLQEAQRTSSSLDKSLGDSSEVRMRLAQMLREFTETARAVRELADFLERNPESVLRGKSQAGR